MTAAVIGAVLAAAILHASWNALAKTSRDGTVLFGQTGVVSAVAAVPVLYRIPQPGRASWFWLGASVVVHVGYTLTLVLAYRAGDFSQTYPIARGLGPLVVALVAVVWLGEPMPASMTAGIVVIAGAVALLGLLPWRRVRDNRAGVLAAVLTGLAIATYTLIDGVGVRRSGSAAGYTVWLMAAQGLVLTVVAVARHRRRPGGTRAAWASWSSWALAGAVAVMSTLAYGLVLWAQTRGALAAVAALRECSVVVAAVIGTVFLREPVGRLRVVCSVAVAAGITLLAVS